MMQSNQRNFFHSSDDIICYSCTLCSIQENWQDSDEKTESTPNANPRNDDWKKFFMFLDLSKPRYASSQPDEPAPAPKTAKGTRCTLSASLVPSFEASSALKKQVITWSLDLFEAVCAHFSYASAFDPA
jgi:hypothetical protein